MTNVKKALPKSKKSPKKKATTPGRSLAQNIILTVIVAAIVAVVVTLICSLTFNTEFEVKQEIEKLSQEYYENYYFANLTSNEEDRTNTLKKFSEDGVPNVKLRQLILNNPEVSDQTATWLRRNCNENATYVKFYPEEPYHADSFRTEYFYSCKF